MYLILAAVIILLGFLVRYLNGDEIIPGVIWKSLFSQSAMYSSDLQQIESKERPPVKSEDIFDFSRLSIQDSFSSLEKILSLKLLEVKQNNTDLSLMIITDRDKTNCDNSEIVSTEVMDYLDKKHFIFRYEETSTSSPGSITVYIPSDWGDKAV